MQLGYKLDDDGHEVMGISVIDSHIRGVDVTLIYYINKDISYPLSSPHNKGFHVAVHGVDDEFITEVNVNDVANEEELVAKVTQLFHSQDEYVMITSANSGETFPFTTRVYDQTAINDKRYDCWDEDAEDLEDNADKVAPIFLNDQLRWQVH